MKYSIIIPSLTNTKEHNKVLEECLESVTKNSEDYEIILVDDGSSVDLSYYPVDVYIHHKTNKGIAVSWNDGIKIARGTFITIINDDITVEEGWLDKLRMALEDEHNNKVAAPGVAGQNNGTGIEESYQWFPGYCFMMRSIDFDSFGLFDEQFSPFNFEDTDMWTRLLQRGYNLVRNYSTTITHKEGHVLHTLDYDEVSEKNKRLFIAKHGFDPVPVFYRGAKAPWTN